MIAEVLDMEVGHFVHTLGDAHIYHNHFEQCDLQLTRDPYPLPKLSFKRKVESLEDFTFDDIVIENYQYHPKIKGDVAV
jgi:thymidylate synthase